MGDIIGIGGYYRALPFDYLAPPKGARQSRNGTSVADPRVAGAELGDEVELSDLGELLSRVAQAPGIRPGRIAKIRSAVVAGTYETPSKIAVVVDRLLEQLKD